MKLGIGIALAILLVGCNGCEPPPKKPAMPERWQDAADTNEGAAKGTPCHRAAANIHKLKCDFDRADFEAFCLEMERAKVPICPLKLAVAKTCKEAEEACR